MNRIINIIKQKIKKHDNKVRAEYQEETYRVVLENLPINIKKAAKEYLEHFKDVEEYQRLVRQNINDSYENYRIEPRRLSAKSVEVLKDFAEGFEDYLIDLIKRESKT